MDETTRRDQWAGTVFSTWVVIGLFLDGWAHNAGKPEDFWTPWHAVLYSGLLVGAAWYVRERRRRRRAGLRVETDRLTLAGFALFGVAGMGDAVWHGLFGVEEDVAALLSPTHLALMLGGLLLVTGPIRRARGLPGVAQRWRTYGHVLAATILAVAVVAFFLQFVSPFHVVAESRYTASSLGDPATSLLGVASVLVTNAVLLAGLAWLLTSWPRPPVGTVTLYLTAVALLLAGLLAFEYLALVGAAVTAGAVGDALLAQGRPRRSVLTAVPLLLWTGWFAVFAAVWGLGWEVELWTGAVVLAAAAGAGLDVVVGARAAPTAPPPVGGDRGPSAGAMRVEATVDEVVARG